MVDMRASIRISRGIRPAVVGLLLVGVTLAGITACATVFSFLMLVCLGTPGLLLLLESLLSS